jgi:hypothetical protein
LDTPSYHVTVSVIISFKSVKNYFTFNGFLLDVLFSSNVSIIVHDVSIICQDISNIRFVITKIPSEQYYTSNCVEL